MQRLNQVLFGLSVLGLCWLAMMAVHELGHVLGAILTGGTVERVVLHPFAISRTDVSPNPHPGIVVWLGPVIGCLLPLTILAVVPKRFHLSGKVIQFFAGFCLIANGAYIACGSFAQIGDCREMLQTGTPVWAMLIFGCSTVLLGFYLWHQLGSIQDFLSNPSLVAPLTAYATFGILALSVIAVVSYSER